MKRHKSQHIHHKSPQISTQSPPNLHQSPLNLHQSPLNLHHSLLSFLPILLLFLFFSCERVIDVDLNETNPEIVIEGNLSYYGGELEVIISKTGSYFSPIPSGKVENARIYLMNEEEIRVNAKHIGQGIYKAEGLPARSGAEYSLHVEAEGREFVAKSTLHAPVKLDSLSYEYQNGARFFDGGYRILLYFSDPPGEENFYRVKVHKNGELLNEVGDLIVFDDNRLDGKGIQVRLRGQLFDAGDTARVQLLTIDRNAWRYFTTFREMASLNPGSPAPANPASNFTNGALGYFSAWSGDEKEIIIE
jgi:hypothetical protein